MFLAGHCPTKEFTIAEMDAMPFEYDFQDGDPPPDGFSRSFCRGAPIVYWFDWEHMGGNYAVRPVLKSEETAALDRSLQFIERYIGEIPPVVSWWRKVLAA